MDKSKLVSGVAMVAAAAAMFVSGVGVSVAGQTDTVKAKCVGKNACKGQGSCAGAANGCKGQNACKGQGWEMLTLAQCTDRQGRQ